MTMTWKRDGQTLATVPTPDDPFGRSERYREALDMIGPKLRFTDVLEFDGEADFGKDLPLYLPPCVYSGQERTKWRHQIQIDESPHKPPGTPGFVLCAGTYQFRSFDFQATCWDKNEDAGLIGWNTAVDSSVSFLDCNIDASVGCDWPIYNWTKGTKVIRATECYVSHCRGGFIMADSGGLNQTLVLDDVTFAGDANGSTTYGESSLNDPVKGGVLAPVIMRGGKVTMKNCRSTQKGLTKPYDASGKYGCPRIVGLVTDQYSNDSQVCQFEIGPGCKSTIVPGIASVFTDIDLRRSKLRILRDEGSGEDGSFKVWGAK